MVPRENKNNAYAKFWRTSKEYYGIFGSGLLLERFQSKTKALEHFSLHVLFSHFRPGDITLGDSFVLRTCIDA